ncbi:hypothetical protein [Pseudoneobacillus rhizosphaerae]|uniref:Uncharacterized protein n=1 Tax=Pseudoneobacillus rhizosphaerae TaxID=2880968 RepID=A0A9C7GC84_9BACI|nr:hypothetical protein [Pseudoneobacillus rhizosphaerae]CAG9609457.1 hypothetical protein NEOCIP111885_03199 [Pseudoneobacillus rhizosphaerae]
MVIQSNMSPKAIVEVWGVTETIFKKYNIPLSNQNLETLLENQELFQLIQELNTTVGSSTVTCIEGG